MDEDVSEFVGSRTRVLAAFVMLAILVAFVIPLIAIGKTIEGLSGQQGRPRRHNPPRPIEAARLTINSLG